MNNVTDRWPDTCTRTNKPTVQTCKLKGGKITVAFGKSGGKGKGKPEGRYGGKTTVG